MLSPADIFLPAEVSTVVATFIFTHHIIVIVLIFVTKLLEPQSFIVIESTVVRFVPVVYCFKLFLNLPFGRSFLFCEWHFIVYGSEYRWVVCWTLLVLLH